MLWTYLESGMGYCVSKFSKNIETLLLKNKQIYCRLVHERLIENNDLLWTYLDQAWVIVLGL